MSIVVSPENTRFTTGAIQFLVYLEKSAHDMGFYSTTDGDIAQEKDLCNFTYQVEGQRLSVFHSANVQRMSALSGATFRIYWGDGTSETILLQQPKAHLYAAPGNYTVELSLETPWTDRLRRTIVVGGSAEVENPLGTLTISVPYSGEEVEVDYTPQLDTTEEDPFISGFTASRLLEVAGYGGEWVWSEEGTTDGLVEVSDTYTAYTVDYIFYTDFPDGLTYYHLSGTSFAHQSLSQLLTKQEALLGVVSDVEVQSDVVVQRGKVSVFEHNLRLSEISSVGEAELYGNGFFTVKKTV